MPGDLRDLLHRRDSLYRHFDFASGLCFASFIFHFCFCASSGVEYDVWASFVPAEFLPILSPAFTRAAAFDLCIESAARTAFASGRVKRNGVKMRSNYSKSRLKKVRNQKVS